MTLDEHNLLTLQIATQIWAAVISSEGPPPTSIIAAKQSDQCHDMAQIMLRRCGFYVPKDS
jgi:hypothetical protein